jgi:hypothetical protein
MVTGLIGTLLTILGWTFDSNLTIFAGGVGCGVSCSFFLYLAR